MNARLSLSGITKAYPAVVANDSVSLSVQQGEIHAVLGENGAGKSTLMKIIYGAVQPDEGTMHWNGQPVKVASPAAARALGISMVYQHFSLFDTLTAAENVWLGLDKAMTLPQVSQRITEVAHTYGLDVDPLRPVHSLSVGERQRVAERREVHRHGAGVERLDLEGAERAVPHDRRALGQLLPVQLDRLRPDIEDHLVVGAGIRVDQDDDGAGRGGWAWARR